MATSRLERIGTIFSRTKGLIEHGAMKPNERPLWYDVYEAFPPAVEPTFARPIPNDEPIRKIIYEEDLIRSKFHDQGYGKNYNMIFPLGETTTKKLIEKYKIFKAEGIPDEEIITKSVAAVENESKLLDYMKPVKKETEGVKILGSSAVPKDIFKSDDSIETSQEQDLGETDLKNIKGMDKDIKE